MGLQDVRICDVIITYKMCGQGGYGAAAVPRVTLLTTHGTLLQR
jgi:hypothetical protein